MKGYYGIATFIMYLVVLLPVSAASVYGDISSGKVYGEDGVDNYVKGYDYTYVIAQVEFADMGDNATVDPSMVRIGNMPFSSCTPGIGFYYDCMFDPGIKAYLNPGIHSLLVRQLDSEGVEIATKQISYFVDSYNPIINTFTVSDSTLGNEDITVNINAADPNDCAGLSHFVVTADGSEVQTISVEDGDCNMQEDITLAATDLTVETGTVELCGQAFDLLGHESNELCHDISVDLSGPSIDDSTLEVTGPDGEPMEYISGDTSAKVVIEVVDTGSDIDSVTADLSELNGLTGYDNKYGSCLEISNVDDQKRYRCTWLNVAVQLTETTNAALTFTATDDVGNAATTSVIHTINLDTEGPVVTSIVGTHEHEGIYYLGSEDNNITVTMSDNGVGFNPEQIFLDLGQVTGQAQRPASGCTESSCWFDGFGVTSLGKDGRTFEVRLSPHSQDKLGNHVVNLIQEFTVDTTAPEVTAITLSRDTEPYDYLTSNDFIQALVNVTEEAHIMLAGVNMSNVVTDLDTVGGECQRLDEIEDGVANPEWVCSFSDAMGPLDQGKIIRQIAFTFVDAAGNTETAFETITVYRDDADEVEPDYVDVRVQEPSPNAINRQLMEYINTFITYPVKIDGAKSNAVPIQVTLGNCDGEGIEILNNADPYANKPRLISNPEDLSEVFVEISFDVQEYPYRFLELQCDMNIISLVDNGLISNTEVETMNFSVEFYNQPFGELSAQVERKLNKTVNGFLVNSLRWLDYLEKIIMLAEKICGLYLTFESIMLIVAKVVSIWGTCCGKEIYSSAACCPQQQVQGTNLDGTKEVLKGTYNKVKKWCSIIGCTGYAPQWFQRDKDGKKIVSGAADKYMNWAMEKNLPMAHYRTNRGYFGNVEPKDSILLSAATFCVPGVVHGLQKMRQIQCQYVDCLEKTKNGLPISICEQQRDYMTCKYVFGEVFNLIPFAAAFGQIMKNVNEAIKNPLNLISTVGSAYCSLTCKAVGTGTACTVCSWFQFAGIFRDVLCDFGVGGEHCKRGIFSKDYWSLDTGICEDVAEEYGLRKGLFGNRG